MGDNQEIYDRLRGVETALAKLDERVHWLERLLVPVFAAGGLVGAAITIIIKGALR